MTTILFRMDPIGGTDDCAWYGMDDKGNPDHGALIIRKSMGLATDRPITVLITQGDEEGHHDKL